tara:strand:- start:133 stop:468 length:336 start_codon:yes stop_codon:yes gene_type:complete
MARTPLNASIEQIATTSLTTLDYTVPASTVSTAFLVLTNASTSILDLSVYVNDGTTNFLLVRDKIAAGIGKDWIVKELPTQKLNAGFTIKVQSTTTDAFNAFLSVSEISDN